MENSKELKSDVLVSELEFCREQLSTGQQHVFQVFGIFYLPLVAAVFYLIHIYQFAERPLVNTELGPLVALFGHWAALLFLSCMLCIIAYIFHIQRGYEVYRLRLEADIALALLPDRIAATQYQTDFVPPYYYLTKKKLSLQAIITLSFGAFLPIVLVSAIVVPSLVVFLPAVWANYGRLFAVLPMLFLALAAAVLITISGRPPTDPKFSNYWPAEQKSPT